MYEPDDGADRPDVSPQRGPPAPVAPLFLGIGAAVAIFLLWGSIGLPLVGIVGGIFSGLVITGLLLWRARPAPPIDETDDGPTRWGE